MDDERVLADLFSHLSREDLDLYRSLTESEKKVFLEILRSPEVYENIKKLDFKRDPVTPEEFLSDPYFIGKENVWDPSEYRGLFPSWKRELEHVLNPENRIYEWILSGSLGAGKCVSENTWIKTSLGMFRIHEIVQLYDNYLWAVDTHNGTQPVTGVHVEGNTETLKVRTLLGNVIEGRPNHRLWVPNKISDGGGHKWVELQDLKEGDLVSLHCGGASLFDNKYTLRCYGQKKVIEFADHLLSFEKDGKISVTIEEGAPGFHQPFLLSLGVVSFAYEGEIHILEEGVAELKSIRDGNQPRSRYELCVEIRSIEKSRAFCYDLSVAEDHSYVANGFVSHNTTAALFSQIYWLHTMDCMRDPKQYFGVLSSSTIEFFLFNTTLASAEDTLLRRFEDLVSSSPYFRDAFPVNRRRRKRGGGGRSPQDAYKLDFPPYFSIVQGSQESHFISRDVIGGILDEASFADNTKASLGKVQYDAASKAFNMYNSLRNRILSRFQEKGRLPGLMCLVSSAATEFSFLEQHKNRNRDNPHVHVSEFASYDIKYWKYGPSRFRVFVGGRRSDPRILGSDESTLGLDGDVVSVPEELRQNYITDLPRALREFSGISSAPVASFFPSKEQLAASATRDYRASHPFKDENGRTVDTITIGHLDPNASLVKHLDDVMLCVWGGDKLRPRHYPDAPRFIHIDLSTTECPTGITMACVSDVKKTLIWNRSENDSFVADAPVIWFDFMLRIPPPAPPEQISYAKIREFIKYLRDVMGFQIKLVTFDGYQSVDSTQILQNWGFESKVFSVDSNPNCYLSLKSTILEDRCMRYPYTPFEEEFSGLQKIEDGNKLRIEKLPGNWKDVADSVAGVTAHCYDFVATGSYKEPAMTVIKDPGTRPKNIIVL